MGRFILFALVVCFQSWADVPIPSGLQPLRPIVEAPNPILNAARAVVRLRTPDGGSGTGFFIQKGELLVTNNHVVGIDNCSREGCYAEIDFDYEHTSKSSTKKVFVVPVFVRTDLDITALEVYEPTKEKPSAKRFTAPNALVFNEDKANTEEGQELYIVGHPFGGLKRWTDGSVYRSTGDWCNSTHCTVPGASGSPVLNKDGQVVGLIHRGNDTGSELTKLEDVRHITYFSRSAAFLSTLKDAKARAASLESFLSFPLSGEKELDDDEDSVGIDGQLLSVMTSRKLWKIQFKSGDEKKELALLDLLLAGCKQDVGEAQNANDPDYEYAFCDLGHSTIQCDESDADYAPERCPNAKARKLWSKLFTDVGEILELNNSDAFLEWHIAAASAFEKTEADKKKKARETLVKLLNGRKFNKLVQAKYLAEHATRREDLSLDGVDYVEVLSAYQKEPFYRQYFEEMQISLQYLAEKKLVSKELLRSLFSNALKDDKMPVTLKADLEAVAFDAGL